jgi:UDP-glucose 4-epimerase
MFNDKTLLITGGTGTFGNAVLKRFLKTDISEIRVFSRDEKKQEDMRLEYASPKLKFYIGDVRDYDSLAAALPGVDYVFHAAALKQVPSCEFYPLEALRTNALGAENVLNASMASGVERAIVLSTDKSVYPINAMGLSKAMMEKLMVAKSRLWKPGRTILCGTRYGNVMASRGSVIPLFIQQVKDGPVAFAFAAMLFLLVLVRGCLRRQHLKTSLRSGTARRQPRLQNLSSCNRPRRRAPRSHLVVRIQVHVVRFPDLTLQFAQPGP